MKSSLDIPDAWAVPRDDGESVCASAGRKQARHFGAEVGFDLLPALFGQAIREHGILLRVGDVRERAQNVVDVPFGAAELPPVRLEGFRQAGPTSFMAARSSRPATVTPWGPGAGASSVA